MGSSALEHPRTELLSTVIFDAEPALDPDPYVTRQGRLIPGPAYAKDELAALLDVVENAAESRLVLPTVRQLARISINAASGCWELPVYQDKKNRARYGIMEIPGAINPSKLAHRSMYTVFYGPDSLPNGRYDLLDHLCENKPCCYPRHLERVTYGTNTMRGRSKVSAEQLVLAWAEGEA